MYLVENRTRIPIAKVAYFQNGKLTYQFSKKKCLLQCDQDSLALYRTYIMVYRIFIMVYVSDIENKQAGLKHPISAEMVFLVKVRGYRESDRKRNLMRQPKTDGNCKQVN